MFIRGGILDGVTYQGTLDLSPDSSRVFIKDGITFVGLGGAGPAAIKLGNSGDVEVVGDTTLDNATINNGTASSGSTIRTNNHTS